MVARSVLCFVTLLRGDVLWYKHSLVVLVSGWSSGQLSQAAIHEVECCPIILCFTLVKINPPYNPSASVHHSYVCTTVKCAQSLVLQGSRGLLSIHVKIK